MTQTESLSQEEIIEMAKQAGLVTNSPYVMPYEHELRGYVSFAKLVAAKERERIIDRNKPELDKCNTYIKELEDKLSIGEV